MIAEAEAKGKITLNRFRQGLTTAPKEYIEQMSDGATQLLKSIENFCLKIETLSQYQIPFFLTIRELITTIIRVTQATLGRSQSDQLQPIEIVKNNNSEQAAFDTKLSLDGNAPSDTNTEESTEVEIIQQRSDAYRALHELGKFLMEIDPHSPTPYLLELIVSWEDKKLLQIVSDVTDGKTEAHNMLKLLAGVATNR
jgi:type VI secretion system protein ImpA